MGTAIFSFASGFDRTRGVERQRVFRREQPRLGEEGDEAQRLPLRGGGDQGHAAGEELRVAAKLVDEKAAYQRRVAGVDHRLGADQAGDHPAAVDVANQHNRDICGAGEAHIGNVVGAEIDLRGAAGALDQNDVGFVFQPREAVQHEPHQLGLECLVLGCRGAATDLSLHHDLCADFALRLEQHRVHVHARRDPGGARLKLLRPADLPTVWRDASVVRHVLRLERQHFQPAGDERAGKTGDDQRFAHI